MRPLVSLVLIAWLASALPVLAHDSGSWDCSSERPHRAASAEGWHGRWGSPTRLDRAWDLHQEGRDRHSAESIRRAIRLEPNVARFHLSLGQVLARDGDSGAAVDALVDARQNGSDWIRQEADRELRGLGVDPRRAAALAARRRERLAAEEEAGGGSGSPSNPDEEYLDRLYGPGDRGSRHQEDPDSLYGRLGGAAAISAVVDAFVRRVAADTRINARFAKTDIPTFKLHLEQQIGAATGGPEVYQGKDMKTVHEGMKITGADFTALVEDLIGALSELNVPKPEQNELLGLLGPMKKDIVEVP